MSYIVPVFESHKAIHRRLQDRASAEFGGRRPPRPVAISQGALSVSPSLSFLAKDEEGASINFKGTTGDAKKKKRGQMEEVEKNNAVRRDRLSHSSNHDIYILEHVDTRGKAS